MTTENLKEILDLNMGMRDFYNKSDESKIILAMEQAVNKMADECAKSAKITVLNTPSGTSTVIINYNSILKNKIQ